MFRVVEKPITHFGNALSAISEKKFFKISSEIFKNKPDNLHECRSVFFKNCLPVIKFIQMLSLFQSFQRAFVSCPSIELVIYHTIHLLVSSFLQNWFPNIVTSLGGELPISLSSRLPVSVLLIVQHKKRNKNDYPPTRLHILSGRPFKPLKPPRPYPVKAGTWPSPALTWNIAGYSVARRSATCLVCFCPIIRSVNW